MTTLLNELPIPNENINMNIQDQNPNQNQIPNQNQVQIPNQNQNQNQIQIPNLPNQIPNVPNQNQVKLDQFTINEIINGLQNAAGSTKIQFRDIPKTTEHLIKDPEIISHYIPETTQKNYIPETIDKNQIQNIYINNNKKLNEMDKIYDEINGPLLIGMLFFIFQLPFFRKLILKYIPFLFNDDLNYSFYGYIFISILFSVIYYIITLGLKQFDKF